MKDASDFDLIALGVELNQKSNSVCRNRDAVLNKIIGALFDLYTRYLITTKIDYFVSCRELQGLRFFSATPLKTKSMDQPSPNNCYSYIKTQCPSNNSLFKFLPGELSE